MKKYLFMVTNHLKLMIWGFAVMVFASCTKPNTPGKLIPKQASVVILANGKSLSSRLSWNEIIQNPLFGGMKGDSTIPAALKSLLDDPENSGMDTQADYLFFALKDSLGGYIAFAGKVKDEGVFKTFNRQMTENGAETDFDGVQYISKFPICVGWTKEKFVYIFDAPQFAKMDELPGRINRDSNVISSVSGRDIGAACKAIFALKESNSLGRDQNFTRLLKESGDFHLWMNSEELVKTSTPASALAMVNLDKFYKGSITTATMNFENGKVLVNAKTYASEEMISLYKKYSGEKINEDMIRRIPGKDVVAVMAMNFKPELIRELVKLTGLDGLINVGVEKLGFTMDDFVKANKGDVLFGFSDPGLSRETTANVIKDQGEIASFFPQKSNFNFIFAASIGDKESFNKLLNAGKKLAPGEFTDSIKSPISFNSNSSYFALSNKKQNVEQYLGSEGTDLDFISKINGEPFGGFLNFQSLLKTFKKESEKDSTTKIAYDASLKIWDNIIWKGGKYSEGGIVQTIEINLVDKSTNSLKQLNQYAAKLGELYEEKRKQQQEEIMAFRDFESIKGSAGTSPGKSK